MASGSRVVFCTDLKVLDDWATRTGLTLPPSGDALSQSYGRAHPWLLHLKDQLVQRFGWTEVPAGDRMLFSVQCNVKGPSGETLTLTLPSFPTSFFSPNRLGAFQAAFQSPLFANTRHSISAVADLLHLLQCLMPGLLTVAMTEQVAGQGTWTTARGLPPVEWVDLNKDQLAKILGGDHFNRLRLAAADKTKSFTTSCK
ncbi:hypothetical protein CPB86DRAFT_796308 [Serendipita vermifera]|nr:hypothetical protein CPB86DRAFT_796308 [Serendipita vermifera]